MQIITDIANDIRSRIQESMSKSGKPPVSNQLLGHADLEGLVAKSSEVITVGITRRAQLVDLASRVGTIALQDLGRGRDSIEAVHIGAFVVESFVNLNLVSVNLQQTEDDKNPTYYVLAGDNSDYADLLTLMDPTSTNFPSVTPYADWTCGVHENGLPFIKNGNKTLLNRINMEDHNITMNAVNRLQREGWLINQPVYTVFRHFYKKGGCPKAFPHQDESKPRVTRSGLATEARYIVECADNLGEQVFYHQYNCDFRGRIYPLSAFLNEQSSDRSKGLMLFNEPKPLGDSGLYWLMVHTANVWGEDKLTLDQRADYVSEHFNEWEQWAEDPINNTGWMDADKPWSFLAAIIELNKVQYFDGEVEDYPCALPIFIDGSNNGVQHMAALTHDETTAPLVNLVPQETPGDVYMAICEAVYEKIAQDLDESLEDEFDAFFDQYKAMHAELESLRGDEFYAQVDKINKFREESQPQRFAPNYFMRITDKKLRRKMVKRPVMTLGYGGTRQGFTKMILVDNQQVNDDFRYMQFSWASYFGDLIYFTARGRNGKGARLPGLAKTLNLFEGLAMKSLKEGKKLSWNVPVTNFPVVQQYQKAKMQRVKLNFMGVLLKLNVAIFEEQTINKSKQKTSAAPNIIHSFDAAHLQMIVVSSSFRTATIHDSFGCLPSDMKDLFEGVRESFVDFYESDPLASLLAQQDAMDMMPERGSLDLEQVLASDFAFA